MTEDGKEMAEDIGELQITDYVINPPASYKKMPISYEKTPVKFLPMFSLSFLTVFEGNSVTVLTII